MKRIDPIILGIVIITVLVVGGIVAVALSSKAPSITQYLTSDQDKPQAEISATSFDFGRIKLSEIKEKEVTLKNSGTKPLVLSDIVTSCDCTFAQVTVASQTSKRFSMQRDASYRAEVAPNATAIIKVIYEPQLMPVKGIVNRSVAIKTNDPDHSLITIGFSADVQP